MSESLDRFLPPTAVKPKQDPAIFVEERCFKCGRKVPITEVRYKLKISGKEELYCQGCAKKILRPQENTETNL